MNWKHLATGFFAVFLAFTTGCQQTVITPTEPDKSAVLNEDLVGCWELVEADSLFEGDLFITCDGLGTEYSIVGREFRKKVFDFRVIEYDLVDGLLLFAGRWYEPKNRAQQLSPCDYFPDEGLVKSLLIDGRIPLTIKTGWNDEHQLFTERRSLWNVWHGFEQDTIWFRVTDDSITVTGVNFYFGALWPLWLENVSSFQPEPRYFDKRYVNDTTFAVGGFRHIQQMLYYDRFCEVSDEAGILDWICYNNLSSCYFAPEIGVVMADHLWYRDGYSLDYSQNRVELIEYFNPLTTVEARRARMDFNHVQRKSTADLGD